MTETHQSLFWKLQTVDADHPPKGLADEIKALLGLRFVPSLDSVDEALDNLEDVLGSVPDQWDFDLGWGWRCDIDLSKANMLLDWRERRHGKADWFEVVEATGANPALAIYACICGAKSQLVARDEYRMKFTLECDNQERHPPGPRCTCKFHPDRDEIIEPDPGCGVHGSNPNPGPAGG